MLYEVKQKGKLLIGLYARLQCELSDNPCLSFSFLFLDATHAVPFPGSLMRHLAPLGSQAWNIEQDVEITGIDCGWNLSCLNGNYINFEHTFVFLLQFIVPERKGQQEWSHFLNF